MFVRLLVLASGAFGLITTELGIIGVLPQLSTAFGIPIQTAGWLLSAFALTVAVAGPGMTLLFSRVDRKWSLCLVLATFVASNLGSAAAPSFGWLLVLRILPAIVHPIFWSVAMTVAASLAEPGREARAISIVFTGMSAGIVLGVPLASLIAGEMHWQRAFILFGALNLFALILHLALLPKLPVAQGLALGAQISVLRKPALWWNLALQVALTASVFSIYGYMAQYLKAVTGMDPRLIGVMLFLFGLAGVIGTLAVGRMMSHDLSRTLLGFLASFTPVMLLLFIFGSDQRAAIALVLPWGFVHAAAVPLCQAIVLRAGPEAPEFSNSLFNSFGNIGITIGTTFGGIMIASFGVQVLPLVSIALLALAAVTFAIERARDGHALLRPASD